MASSSGLRAQKAVPIKTKRATSTASSSGAVPKGGGRRRIADLYDGVVHEANRAVKEGLPYSGA